MASADTEKKKALGRGLASLIPDVGSAPLKQARKDYFECDIEKITPNTYQPRKIFDKEALQELVESIKAQGIIQPLVVQIRDGHYELIAGERRWRAAQKAGLKKVPVVVKEVDTNANTLAMALIENIQRENLNSIEEAIAYQQLIDEFQLSQEEVATRVGKNRVTITNTLRLLKLPKSIQEDITHRRLTMGHARALISLETSEQQLLLRDEILKKKLSVRDTEKRVNDLLKGDDASVTAESAGATGEDGGDDGLEVHIKALEDNLRRHYGTKVQITGHGKQGMIQLTYTNKEDLTRIGEALLWNFNSN